MIDNSMVLLTELSNIFSDEKSEKAAVKQIIKKYNERYNLLIKVEGEDFNLSFPSSFAESLYEIQRNFYKSVAFALHGEDDMRKLTSTELKEYEIIFTLQPGCTEFLTNIVEKLTTLAEKVMEGMDAKEKAAFFLKLVCVIAGTVLVSNVVNSLTSYKTISTEQTTKQVEEQEETKRIEAALNRQRGSLPAPQEVVDHFEKSTADSEQAVLKGAKNANKVVFRNKTFEREAIEEANQRSTRTTPGSKIINGLYHVVVINSRDSSLIRLTISDNNGNDMSVALDTQAFDPEEIESIWDAAKRHRPINLNINATLSGNTIKHAYVAGIGNSMESNEGTNNSTLK